MSKIKICGMRRIEDIRAVNEAKPDFAGFIFDKTRRRYVEPQLAMQMKQALLPGILAVGVFVNVDPAWIEALAAQGIFDIVQLHGQETEAELRNIKAATKKPVIKAVSVREKRDLLHWMDSEADYLLFDNGAGGTGQTFDWKLLEGYEKPYFLAGGINAENLEQALQTGAYALDVSGGVETDGYKDPEKIARLVQQVRKYT